MQIDEVCVPGDHRSLQRAYSSLVDMPVAEAIHATNCVVSLGLPKWSPAPVIKFGANDTPAAQRLVRRRGLPLADAIDAAASTVEDGAGLVYAVGPAHTLGKSGPTIDHIVLSTGDPNRFIATFSGRLGADLRRERVAGPIRQLFFRSGPVLVEVIVHDDAAAPDTLWGLAWAVTDIDAEHQRLTSLGVDVSDVRAAVQPGAKVMTVRDPDLGVATMLIQPAPR